MNSVVAPMASEHLQWGLYIVIFVANTVEYIEFNEFLRNDLQYK
jgi:hypothetical protein